MVPVVLHLAEARVAFERADVDARNAAKLSKPCLGLLLNSMLRRPVVGVPPPPEEFLEEFAA